MVQLEVCIDSILSAINASEAGAHRVELCSALSEGGLTPSVGLFKGVKKAIGNTKTKIFCMIRIRRGNFDYSADEIDAMVEDVKYFKDNGADGIVIGCLDKNFTVHVKNCQQLINAWERDKPVTFHRAFDETNVEDLEETVEVLSLLGIKRILTSGFMASAEQGIDNLKILVERAKAKEIIVMPGAGVTKSNVARIVSETQCKEIHASARSEWKSPIGKLSMGGGKEDLQPLMVCDQAKVKELIAIANQITF